MKEKDASIECLRVFAIALVILFHMLNDPIINSARYLYDYIDISFQNIRMPLFTIISGYLYGLRPVRQRGYADFLSGKFRRLLVPFVFVASLEFLLKSFLPGVNNPTDVEDVWKVIVYPYEHYWFIQVVFLIFVFVGLLDYLGKLSSISAWLLVFGASVLLYLVYPLSGLSIKIFSIGAVTYLLPFFLLGVGIARFSRMGDSKLLNWAVLSLFICSTLFMQVAWFYDMDVDMGKRSILSLVVALSTCYVVMAFRKPVPGLHRLGPYVFTIYLYQGIGMAIGRRVVGFFSEINPHIYVIVVLLVTIIFGVLVHKAFSRIPFVSSIFLGIKSVDTRRPVSMSMS